MDADRFDRFAKSFGVLVTRRRGLGLLAALGLGGRAVVGEGAAREGRRRPRGGGDAAGPGAEGKRRGRKRSQRGACRISDGGAAVTTTITVRHKRLTLTQVDTTPRDPREPATSTTTVRRKRAVLLEITTAFGGGAVAATISYGKAFKGIRRADLSVSDGVVSGEIDGRAIVPFDAASVPDALQFEDGQPAPETVVGKETRQHLAQIFARAQARQLACGPGAAETARSRVSTANAGDCMILKGACVLANGQCGWAAAAGCNASLAVPFIGPGLYGLCLVAATAACVAAFQRCMTTARESRACCPVDCGDLPDFSCCQDGEQCLTPSSNFGVCCPRDHNPCHETTCCAPFEKCRPDGQCCRSGTSPCGTSNCCPDAQTCMRDGSCCEDGKVCGGTGGTCCGRDQSCVNNRCTEVCNPDRQVTCLDLPGYADCCERGTICCSGGQCCPLFAPVCCGGDCCLSSQECCPDNVCRSTCLR